MGGRDNCSVSLIEMLIAGGSDGGEGRGEGCSFEDRIGAGN